MLENRPTSGRTLFSLLIAGPALLSSPMAGVGQQVPPEIIDERPAVIQVTASATVQYEPDQASVSFAVVTFAATAAEATEGSAAKMTRIQEALTRMGIGREHVRTTDFRLDPHYPPEPERQGRQPQPDGYMARNMIDVRLEDIGSVGAVIDAVIGAGADHVSNLGFSLNDMRPVRRAALKMAYENAELEAEALALAAGRLLGPLLAVRTPPEAVGYPLVQAEMAFARGTPTPIEPGTLSYTASVAVTFEVR